MADSSAQIPVRRNTSLVRVLLSAVLLGLVIWYVQKQQPGPKQVKTLPVEVGGEDMLSHFAWVPRYPGVDVDGIRTKRTSDQMIYGFQFNINGDFQPALAYYESQLKAAGFRVERKHGGEVGAAMHAEDTRRRRTVEITAGKLQGVSEIDVTATEHVGL